MRPERDALEIQFPRVEGYRVELPEERLEAVFDSGSMLTLTPDLVGEMCIRDSLSIIEQTPHDVSHLRKNPLGVYVDGLDWSRELAVGDSGETK